MMMQYHVEFTRRAQKQLPRIPLPDRTRILQGIRSLEDNPFVGKKLRGEYEGLRSLRVWPYRVIYEMVKRTITVTIVDIQHRQGAYR